MPTDLPLKPSRLLHVIHDDKFINAMYNVFNEVEGLQNDFIYLSAPRDISWFKNVPFRFIRFTEMVKPGFVKKLVKPYTAIIFHGLNDRYKFKLLEKIPDHKVVFWSGLGGDYYTLIQDKIHNLYEPQSLALRQQLVKEELKRKTIKERLFDFLFFSPQLKARSLKRVDFFAPVLPSEYAFFKRYMPEFKAEKIEWNSGSLENGMLSSMSPMEIKGQNILLGNSATPENNHLDLFSLLKQSGIKYDQLICPLSYGQRHYKDVIIQKGHEQFGERFMPLVDFLPLADYLDLTASCPVVVMGHKRQQATGNIIASLFHGCKVFLSAKNPVYQYYSDQGMVIFNLEQLSDESVEPLSHEQAALNRTHLIRLYGQENHRLKTRNLILRINEKAQEKS